MFKKFYASNWNDTFIFIFKGTHTKIERESEREIHPVNIVASILLSVCATALCMYGNAVLRYISFIEFRRQIEWKREMNDARLTANTDENNNNNSNDNNNDNRARRQKVRYI